MWQGLKLYFFYQRVLFNGTYIIMKIDEYEISNIKLITLIGMMGSGKTTCGSIS